MYFLNNNKYCVMNHKVRNMRLFCYLSLVINDMMNTTTQNLSGSTNDLVEIYFNIKTND